MSFESYLNVYMLLTALVGLFLCLYRYVETPKKVWALTAAAFLTQFISDYYWAVNALTMNNDSKTSSFLSYFGWNVSYVFMILLIISLQRSEERKYFNVLMLIPIPLNILQFILYIPYGGIINNIWQGLSCTAIACLSIRSILYYFKNKKEGAKFPAYQLITLLFVICEYGMWTSSCFSFENQYLNPYYYFAIVCFTLNLAYVWAVRKTYVNPNKEADEKYRLGTGVRMALHLVMAFIIFGCCFGGYAFAKWMNGRLFSGITGNYGENDYNIISIILFGSSVVLVAVILGLMLLIRHFYKRSLNNTMNEREIKGKVNFVFTLTVTFLLMVFAVFYTSRLLYRESVERLYGDCENKMAGVATSLSNYLNNAEAILWVTGDSVDTFLQNSVDIDTIHNYLRIETKNQADTFDDNFIGLYGYVRGVYLDSLDWVPPEGYEPTERDWYKYAVAADGEVAIVPPYVDMSTGQVIISITKLLSDKESVLSSDVTLNHIQDTVSELDINGNGYGMIVDSDGFIVSHKDRELNGKNCSEVFGSDEIMKAILGIRNGRTEIKMDGYRYTLFVNEVLDQWYSVVVVRNMELLSDVNIKLTVNVCVYIIIFFLITFFYYLSYMNEQSASEAMEELTMERQKQEYEAKVLKLEKTAADDANKAKSRFLADMSHEIRTPINAVLGMNEMILRETDSESIREYAGNIRTSGRALLNLINSILDFSKIEDGKMEIVPVDYSTVDMINYLHNSIFEKTAAKNLSFVVDVDETIPMYLHGDDMRLSQVIMNLLTNAVKYTKEGEVRLTFRNAGRIGNDVNLFVEVKDTGSGIRSEDMAKLFESFERLDMEKNRNIEGTGLGMSIVTRLLSMMDSELSVKSEYGVGSEFSFVIKQGIADEKEIGDTFVRLKEGSRTDNGKTYHETFHAPDGVILIVDDTKMNLNVAKNLLKRTLLTIDTALSGDEALKLCDSEKYDVIFMDQRMPGMDGTETLKCLRSRKDGPNIETPVICLTADAISGARDRYIAEGFSDYLTKPIDSSELEKMLITYLPDEKIIKDTPGAENTGNVSKEKDTYIRPEEESAVSGPEEEKTQKDASDKTPVRNDYADSLKQCGIDVQKGLSYCQNDEDVYIDVLTEYAKESKEKKADIAKAFASKDWKEYSVFVHSLKSTSKLIGALGLSEKAAKLEIAGNESNEEYILKEHDGTMELYNRVCDCISNSLNVSTERYSSDEEILEFLPQ